MSQINRNSGFATQDIVTAAKLHNLVDTATLGPESVSAQSPMGTNKVAQNDFVLGFDSSVSALRKFSIQEILNATGVTPTFEGNVSLGSSTVAAPPTSTTTVNGNFTIRWPETVNNTLTWVPNIVLSRNVQANNNNAFLYIKPDINVDVGSTVDFAGGGIKYGEGVGAKEIDIFTHGFGDASANTAPTGLVAGTTRVEVTGRASNRPVLVNFNANTRVTVKDRLRLDTNSLIYLGAEKTNIADEVTINPADLIKGVYDVDLVQMSPASWHSTTDARVSYANVPTIGKILVNQTFTIPKNEKWVFEYVGQLSDGTDDNIALAWQIVENNVAQTFSHIQFDRGNRGGENIGIFQVIEGGASGKTITIRLRGAVTDGSGYEGFTVFSNEVDLGYYNFSRFRRITKIRI